MNFTNMHLYRFKYLTVSTARLSFVKGSSNFLITCHLKRFLIACKGILASTILKNCLRFFHLTILTAPFNYNCSCCSVNLNFAFTVLYLNERLTLNLHYTLSDFPELQEFAHPSKTREYRK